MESGERRWWWYARFPLLWLLGAGCLVLGDFWELLAMVVVVLALWGHADRLDGAARPGIPRTTIERRALWVTGGASVVAAVAMPFALDAAYQGVVMEQHRAEVLVVGEASSGPPSVVSSHRNLYVRVDDGELLWVQVPRDQAFMEDQRIDVWLDTDGPAEPRVSWRAWLLWLGVPVGGLALADSWLRRRHRGWWGAAVEDPGEEHVERGARPSDPRRLVRWLGGVGLVSVPLLVVSALREPDWTAGATVFVAMFVVGAALALPAAWGKLARRDDGTDPVGCWFAVPVLALMFLDGVAAVLLPWAAVDLGLRATVPAEQVTVTRVVDRAEHPELYVRARRDGGRWRGRGSVLTVRRAGGEQVEVLTGTPPDEVDPGDRLSARFPEVGWVRPRTELDEPPEWAWWAAAPLLVLVAAQAGAVVAGYRRLPVRAPTGDPVRDR